MTKTPFLTTRQLCACALGAALLSICTWISIPGPIPFTMQTFAVFLLTGLLGLKCGMLSLTAYLLLGFAGLPVFSGFRGGPGVLLGATGGYLVGFFFTAVIIGLVTKRFGRGFCPLAFSMAAGMAACYLFGSVWYLFLYTDASGLKAVSTVFLTCVAPFLLPDALKLLLATVLVRRLKDHILV